MSKTSRKISYTTIPNYVFGRQLKNLNYYFKNIDIRNNYSCNNIDKKFHVGSVNEFYL